MNYRRFKVVWKDIYWPYRYEKLSTTEPIVDPRMKNVLTAIKIPIRTVGLTSLATSSLKTCALLLEVLFSTEIVCTVFILLGKSLAGSGDHK